MARVLLACLLTICAAAAVSAGGQGGFDPEATWPQWRGIDGTGITPDTDWDPDKLDGKPDIVWTSAVGAGYSSLSVADGHGYTVGHDDGSDVVTCFDAAGGDILWQYSYEAVPGQYPGPRATPAIYNETLFVLAQSGVLFCLNRADGDLLWSRDLVVEYGAVAPEWGFAGSPVIRDNVIYINACLAGIALDPADGSLIWKTKSEISGYASPVFMTAGGVDQVVIFGARALFGVGTATGEIIWEYPWETGYDVNAADPLVIGNRVFISSGYRRGCALIDIGPDGGTTAWESRVFNSHFSSFVYYDGYIYGNDGDANSHRGSFKCIRADTGELMWEQKAGVGSLIIAGNYLVTVTERRRIAVVELSPDGYSEAAACTLPKGLIWSPPVLVGGMLFIRGMNGELYALRV